MHAVYGIRPLLSFCQMLACYMLAHGCCSAFPLVQASMENDTDQLRTQLSSVQADLASQLQLTQAAVDSEAAMQVRLTAEEENNNALKAALDMQTQVHQHRQQQFMICCCISIYGLYVHLQPSRLVFVQDLLL